MSDEQGGYRIGFRELYIQISEVSAKLDTISDQQSQRIANNTARIEVLEKAMKMFWTRLENSKSNGWQVNLAIASSLIALLGVLAQLIAK